MFRRSMLVGVWMWAAGWLVACGGANEAEQESSRSAVEKAAPVDDQAQAMQQQGARLNALELQQLAKSAVSSRTAKSVPEFYPYSVVYRVFNPGTRGHFFTGNAAELDRLALDQPGMTNEGPAFVVKDDPDSRPVYRFFDIQRGVHFYTISDAERAYVAANLPRFVFEGVAFRAQAVPASGYVPLYRFFSRRDGVHFYTASPGEAATVRAQSTTYLDEGIAFYVMPEPGMAHVAEAGLAWLNEQAGAPLTADEVLNPVSFLGTGLAFESALNTPTRQHLLIRDATAWQVFLEATAGQLTFTDPVPTVDFGTHQILALNLANTSGCSGDQVLQVIRSGDVVQAVIQRVAPSAVVMCTAIHQASPQFLVIPLTGTVQVVRLDLMW